MHKINKFRLTHKLFILCCHTSVLTAHRRRRRLLASYYTALSLLFLQATR